MSRKMSSRELTILAVLLFIDIVSKILAKLMGVGVNNLGVSYGFFTGIPVYYIFTIEFVFLVMVYILLKSKKIDGLPRLGLILMFTGGLGNLVWRLLFGGVIDWLEILFLPSFNIADILISVGAVVTILSSIWGGID